MDNNPTALLDEAQQETSRLVAAITPEQWSAPTPCTAWSVRDLLNHLVAGNRWFAAMARGEDIERSAFAGDQLGDDPVASYRDSAQELQQAVEAPGALDRTYTLPVGRLPGPAMVTLRLIETITHGWDLGRATGQTPNYSAAAVQIALATSERLPRRTGPGGPFAPATEPGPNASDLDRLAALLGRQTT
jgi:uncharacterized protein (TIGR03086 family)